MSNSRQLAMGPMPLTKSDADVTPKRRQNMAEFHDGAWVLRDVEEAQIDTMPQKEMLYWTKLDRSQWHAGLLGLGHLSILRLGMVPDPFWFALCERILRRKGRRIAIVEDLTRPETDAEKLDRHLLMLLNGWPVVRDFARKYAQQAVKK